MDNSSNAAENINTSQPQTQTGWGNNQASIPNGYPGQNYAYPNQNNNQGYPPNYQPNYYQNTAENSNWKNSIAPEFLGYINNFQTPNDFANAYAQVLSILDRSPANWNEQDYKAFSHLQEVYSGIPSTAEGYNIDTYPTNNQVNTLSQEDVNILKNVSHALGLNKSQAQNLYGALNVLGNNLMANVAALWDQKVAKYGENLRLSWGDQANNKLANVRYALYDILPKLTGESLQTIISECLEMGAHVRPFFLKLLAAIGELGGDGRSQGYYNISPEDARIRLDNMKSNPSIMKILTNPRHPNYESTNREFRQLLAIKNGELR